MLSYQHAYHAGDPADVVKHTLWAALLDRLVHKDKPLHVYETHSGRGLYPVYEEETVKLNAYSRGLGLFFQQANVRSANPYLRAVAMLNPTGILELIPGSPALAVQFLLPQDHLVLCEAHKAEFEYLRDTIHRPHLHLHHADGHSRVPKLVREGERNLVLIDPSYEVKTEYGQTLQTVKSILEAAPHSAIMVWYPLLPAGMHMPMVRGLGELAVNATFRYELTWRAKGNENSGMYGTGAVILNLPYKLEDELPVLLKELVAPLQQEEKVGGEALLTATLSPRV